MWNIYKDTVQEVYNWKMKKKVEHKVVSDAVQSNACTGLSIGDVYRLINQCILTKDFFAFCSSCTL